MTPMERGRAAIEALPAAIKIAGFDFELVKADPEEARAGDWFGITTANHQRIKLTLDPGSPHHAADVALHEINHALWWVFGLKDKTKEERIVRSLASGMIAVYRDNPWLLGWIERCLKGWPVPQRTPGDILHPF